MTKKKTKTDEKKDETIVFDWRESLTTIEVSDMLKAGFIYYIETNNLTFNSEKELEKELTKFKEMNAGA